MLYNEYVYKKFIISDTSTDIHDT